MACTPRERIWPREFRVGNDGASHASVMAVGREPGDPAADHRAARVMCPDNSRANIACVMAVGRDVPIAPPCAPRVGNVPWAWQVAYVESFAGGVSVRPLPPAWAPGPRRARRRVAPNAPETTARHAAHRADGAAARWDIAPYRNGTAPRDTCVIRVRILPRNGVRPTRG